MEIKKGVLIVSTHDFKTNLSKYLRLLRKGEVEGIVVRRYRRHLAMMVPLGKAKGKAAPPAAPPSAPVQPVDLVHQH